MNSQSRRSFIRTAGAAVALTQIDSPANCVLARERKNDSLPMQLYKSLTDEQQQKVCLPVDHPRRKYVSNWWYIHPDYRITNAFNAEQQELIQKVFDSLHSADHQEAVNKQVRVDQYGEAKNAPAVGFFGTPKDKDFEFIYTGHHVTRRCNVHTDKGLGFGGNPIFYGHFPEDFHETKDHPGNPYWYQGKVFNTFVQTLDEQQRREGLVSTRPRRERPNAVIKKREGDWPGLKCSLLNTEQKELFVNAIKKMLAMFREDDVAATISQIEEKSILDQLHVSWYGGKYDIGADGVWDTWLIEGPDMVWYFRGEPHIHCYFHLKA